jgi:acetyltransferase-like isoleucine patch superfamily enzyme
MISERRRLRLVQTLGGLGYLVLTLVATMPSHRLRRAAYRLCGMRLAHGAHLYAGVEVRDPRRISIGRRTSIGRKAILDGRGMIRIGDNVNLSSEAAIWTMQHRVQDPGFGVESAPVVVGDRAWLSFRCTVLPGVTIGEGAVVAAGAVVTGDVAPYTIVAGIPARRIGTRRADLHYAIDRPPPFL